MFRRFHKQLNHRLTMFCNPWLTSFTKRADRATHQKAAFFTFPGGQWVTTKHL